MTELEKLNKSKLNLDLLNKHSNNHERRKYIRLFLTKELIEELLIKNEFSALHIAENILNPLGFRTNAGNVIDLAKEFNLKTRTCKESSNSKFVREKCEKKCIEKYGQKNPLSKNTIPYHKKNKTVFDKYGTENVFQLEEIKEKSKNTLFERYGVYHNIDLPFRERNSGRRSKIQIMVENYLIEKKINFQSEIGKIFRKFNNDFNKIYSPIVDILIEDCKLVIEIYGDKWHANPKIYKDTDLIKTWDGWQNASWIRNRDKARKLHIESFNYKVIEFWECDIKKNFRLIKDLIDESVKNKINF
jgi:very-short-patch-repair endonuclease